MIDLSIWLTGLAALGVVALLGWLWSLVRRDVSGVDSLWSLMFVVAGGVYVLRTEAPGPRAVPVLVLVAVWALRLSAYITWRNHGQGEDRRYQEIRRRNEPNFALKSLFIVFGFQALLAWVVSLPLLATARGQAPWGALDAVGLVVFGVGLFFETVGDLQLARFKADPANRGLVMDRGLWRYTRHPNYFGDFCVWWGLFLLGAGAGGFFGLVSPLVMSVLLLRVSGVALLEKNIAERRPRYAEYVRKTSAFFPLPPRA
jgi:steroid 5-alpha reductase family enzyme